MVTNKEGYMHEYYLKNKDKIYNNMMQKVICTKCKSEINKGNMSRHLKSKNCEFNSKLLELLKIKF